MKKKLADFIKLKGHLVVAALCLIIVAVVGLVIVNKDTPKEPVISYNTPASNIENNNSDYTDIFDDEDSDSADVSKPIKDDEAESTETPKPNQISITKPLNGEIQTEFAAKKLVYNTTLQEWRTHTGIDIKGEKNCDIKAAADGKISAIKNDPKYGLTIVMEHSVQGRTFSTIYCGLAEIADTVSEGKTIKAGNVIGKLGDNIFCEKAQGVHLHFELIEKNSPLNPTEYWK